MNIKPLMINLKGYGNKIKTNMYHAGKYLDQPIGIAKFGNVVPWLLALGGVSVCLSDTYRAPIKERKNTFIKSALVLTFTILSAIISAKGIGKIKIKDKEIFKGFKGLTDIQSVEAVKVKANDLVKKFINQNPKLVNDKEILSILEKAKTEFLTLSEVKKLYETIKDATIELNSAKGKKQVNFLNQLIPDPEEVTSKKCFEEIGKLSLLGLIPVVSGVIGGILGDKLTEDNIGEAKEKIPNKIKEAFYQFFANIFLCNIGAGVMLFLMEILNVKSKWARALAMVTGISLTGVLGGSAIANWLSKKVIDPIFCKNGIKTSLEEENNCKLDSMNIKNLYQERKPELLDLGLHVDDIATVAVMSGLKWIEPILPITYSLSGYRAGIGYRNGDDKCHHHFHHHKDLINFNKKDKKLDLNV